MARRKRSDKSDSGLGCLLVVLALVVVAAIGLYIATVPTPARVERAHERLEQAVPAPSISPAPSHGGVVCRDGTRSPSRTTCGRGCCSGHGGCR